jgi:hypothetical protein
MSNKLEYPRMPLWDSKLSRPLGFQKHENKAIEFCKELTGHKTVDGQGISWFVMGPHRFEIVNGRAPVILADPGEYFGSGLEQRNHAMLHEKYEAQQTALAYAKQQIIASWPMDIVSLLEDENESLSYRQIYEHFDFLRNNLVITETEVRTIKSAISLPFQRNDNIDAFTKRQLNNIRRLEQANHALNDEDAISAMKSAFTTTHEDRTDFSEFFKKFMLDNPSRANRTPGRFVDAINTFVAHLLPHFTETRQAMAVSTVPEKAAIGTTDDSDDENPTALIAIKSKQKSKGAKPTPPAKTKRAARGAPFDRSAVFKAPAGWVAPTGPPQVSDPVYCWSHGCKGHPSNECESMKRGHQDGAIYRKQMNGVPGVAPA